MSEVETIEISELGNFKADYLNGKKKVHKQSNRQAYVQSVRYD